MSTLGNPGQEEISEKGKCFWWKMCSFWNPGWKWTQDK